MNTSPFIKKAVYRTAIGGAISVGTPLTLSFLYSRYEYAQTPEDQISALHTPYSVWVQAVTNLFMTSFGARSASGLKSSCKDAARINERLLLELTQTNKDTAYGRDFRLGEITSREDFRRRHPITEHDHYDPYIRRVCSGEKDVMFAGTPRVIGETSGTSGTRKPVPINTLQRKKFFQAGIGVTFDALRRGVKEHSRGGVQWPNLQKSCKLMISPKYSRTSSGIKVGPNSSAPGDNKTLLQLYTTPEAAWEVQNESELLFLHCLYALLDQNLGFIESNFAPRVFNFFVTIDERWDDLVRSVETGRLPRNLDIDPSVREALEKDLRPDRERANELRLVKSTPKRTGDDRSFARLVWPNLHTILAVETGSFKLYGEKLRQEWIGNAITIYSPLYAATEGLIGVNHDTDKKTYVLHPRAMFFEFLPIEESDASAGKTPREETLFIEQLEPGKEYEMIITNLTGLCRYRFGDVVRCVGYDGEAPLVEFAYRKGQFLNAQGERTSEEAFYSALSRTVSEDWGLRLTEYTTVEYFARKAGDRSPRYTVYVELTDKATGKRPVTRPLTESELDAFDKRLAESNEFYALFRCKEHLRRADAIPVRPGTFERMRVAMINGGISPTQLKQPRVTRNEELIRILEEGAVRNV